MGWQLLLVAACVAAAAWYLGRQAWRTWAVGGAGCGGGCHCPSKPKSFAAKHVRSAAPLISADELTVRLRRRR